MKKVILIMAAALIFAACGKDNEEVIPTNSEEKVHFTFECNREQFPVLHLLDYIDKQLGEK